MQAEELLASLKARFGCDTTGRITIQADEVAEWPQGLFDQLIADKLLKQAEPTHTLECRGCEEACYMPVHVFQAEGARPARAFIACDKRDDVGRVAVDFARTRQWHMTHSGFEKLLRTWVVSTPADAGKRQLKKSTTPAAFRSALENLLVEIERRASAQSLAFDRFTMPARKCDFQALADKYDPILEHTPRSFSDYLKGLCTFGRGARETDFYSRLFPEYFK
jgi:hypothetical protein